jgi:hypothetical protein
MEQILSFVLFFSCVIFAIALHGQYASEIINEPHYPAFLKNLIFFTYTVFVVNILLCLTIAIILSNIFVQFDLSSVLSYPLFAVLLIPSYFLSQLIVDKIIHPQGLFYFPIFKKTREFVLRKVGGQKNPKK